MRSRSRDHVCESDVSTSHIPLPGCASLFSPPASPIHSPLSFDHDSSAQPSTPRYETQHTLSAACISLPFIHTVATSPNTFKSIQWLYRPNPVNPAMFASASASLQRIESGNVDGRARSPRYIQNQLTSLYNVLVANKQELREALSSAEDVTEVEVELELHLALDTVRQAYNRFDFEAEIAAEYSVARGEDAPERRVAHGIVYLIPSSHTLLYSITSPMSAAITAGNCVVVEVSSHLVVLIPTLTDTHSCPKHCPKSAHCSGVYCLRHSTRTPSPSSTRNQKPPFCPNVPSLTVNHWTSKLPLPPCCSRQAKLESLQSSTAVQTSQAPPARL